MRICVAQTKPVTGDFQRNIDKHKELIDLAVTNEADMIIFPELSITGYEPEQAKKLATHPNDKRFDEFQKISDIKRIIIGIGVPLKDNSDVSISMLLFQPNEGRKLYSKRYLHADEEPFFVAGQNSISLLGRNSNIAFAICYEISILDHAENAFKNGAKIYVASVAKFEDKIDRATNRLAKIASDYSMTVLMSNFIGSSNGQKYAGRTSIWNKQGSLVGQLSDKNEGVLIIDTDTQEVIEETILYFR